MTPAERVHRRLGMIAHEEECRYDRERDLDGRGDGKADRPPRTLEEGCSAGQQAGQGEEADRRQGDEERQTAKLHARDDCRTRLPHLTFGSEGDR